VPSEVDDTGRSGPSAARERETATAREAGSPALFESPNPEQTASGLQPDGLYKRCALRKTGRAFMARSA
jgi:hypothetical protein